MNVLFIHEVDWLGKIVFDIHSLAESLSLLGHQVYAIDFESMSRKKGFFDFGSLKTKVIDNAARANPKATICLRRPGFIKFPGLGHPSAVFTHYLEIKKTIKEKNIEAIVLYSAATNGLQTLYLARKFNIPVLFRAIDILHQLVPFPSLRPVVKFLEQQVYSRVDLLLPHTPNEAKYLTAMGAQETKIKLLSLPVEMNLFHPSPAPVELRQKWGFDGQDQIILFQGTLYPFSGLDLFLRQLPRLLEQIPNAKLLLVGDGLQRPVLEEIVTQLNLQSKVVMTGFQPYDMVPSYINLASVCINPFFINDITREIFPGKIPQYLACGKPVVSTALPGLKAVIKGEKQGIIYVNSIPDMANQIIRLLKANEPCQKLGQAGLNYTRQVHSSEQVGRQLETILKEAIEEKHDRTKTG